MHGCGSSEFRVPLVPDHGPVNRPFRSAPAGRTIKAPIPGTRIRTATFPKAPSEPAPIGMSTSEFSRTSSAFHVENEANNSPCAGRAFVLGTGSAFGNHYSEQEMVEAFHVARAAVGDTDYDKDFVNRVFAALRYDSHSVALPKDKLFKRFSRAEYIEHRRIALTDLAERAARKALEAWGGDPSTITHLYWGTMTGAMDSPTIDVLLAKRLGLNLDVQRTSIEGMGCLTGFRLTNIGRLAASSCRSFRVLVVAGDLRSAIGNSMPDKASKADIISAALFRDAASAVVLGTGLTPTEIPLYEILAGKSQIVPDTGHLVDYVEQDGGAIRLNLAKDLPEAVKAAEHPFVEALLATVRDRCPDVVLPPLTEFDIACHTGGPKILEKVGEGLGLDSTEHLRASWAVMKANGNLSGASNLAVLDEQNRMGADGRNWLVCLSMGPGVCIEGMVMRRPGALTDPGAPAPIEHTRLGDAGVEKMVSDAVAKKARAAHVSTDYVGKRGWRGWLTFAVVAVLTNYLWIEVALALSMDSEDGERGAKVAVLLPLAILLSAVSLCMNWPLDHATSLSFWGIMLFHLGAAVNLLAGSAFVSADHPELLLPGTVVGTSLLALGMVVFCWTSFVYMAWQFMVQTWLLSIAFLLRSSSSAIWAWGIPESNSDLQNHANAMDVAAAVLYLIGLMLGAVKAFHNMQAPWLTPPNYLFFGTVLYALGEVLGNSTVVGLRFRGDDITVGAASVVDNTSRAVLYCASMLLLLDTSRVAYHLEKTIDFSYPATTSLTTFSQGLWGWTTAAMLMATASVCMFIAHIGLTSSSSDKAQSALSCLASLLVAGAFGVAAAMSAAGQPSEASTRGFGAVWQGGAAALLFVGSVLIAGSHMGGSEEVEQTLALSGHVVALGGCGVWAALALMLPAPRRWRVTALPLSWVHLLHPGNYFLLSVCYLSLSLALSLADLSALAAVALLTSAILLTLHTAMAWHAWNMKHESPMPTPPGPPEQEDHPLAGEEPDHEVDVMICGGGPTGLLLASILGRHGVKTMLVERRQGPVTDARWTVINSASLEHLSKILDRDLYRELRQRAMPDSTPMGTMLVSGMGHDDAQVLKANSTPSRKELMDDLGNMPDIYEARSLGSKHAAELPLRANQSHQEAVLKKQVERMGSVKLLYGHVLEDMTTVTRKDSSGRRVTYVMSKVAVQAEDRTVLSTFLVRSRYIVGTDGPRSTVATKLGIQFDGFLNLAKTRSILVKAPGLYEKVLDKLGGTFMYQIARPKFGFAGVVAADPKEQLWNFLMMFGPKTTESSAETICQEFLGTEAEPVQDRFWYWNFFLARQMRAGPGMLAGDAAHSWPPFGALGGNQGYGDACNLGWKLAACCKGWGSELLLESYNSERRQAAVQTALFVLNHSPRPELINKLLPLSQWPLVRSWFSTLWAYLNSGAHNVNHFSQSGIQLGTKYSHSPTVCAERWGSLPDDPFCEYVPVVHSGARLPYVELAHPDGAGRVSIYALVQERGFTLLNIVDDDDDSDSAPRSSSEVLQASFAQVMREQLGRALQGRGSTLQISTISRQELHRIASHEGGARAQAAALLAEERLVLVRPDHYVAWHWARSSPVPEVWEPSAEAQGGQDAGQLSHRIADTVTGLDCLRADRSGEFRESAKSAHCRSFQAWLTARFLHNLRPFVFNFPKAVPIENHSKDEAQHRVRVTIEGAQHTKLSKRNANGAAPFEMDFDITTANIDKGPAPLPDLASKHAASVESRPDCGAGCCVSGLEAERVREAVNGASFDPLCTISALESAGPPDVNDASP